MNPTIVKAVIVVTFALIFYSIAVITEKRKKSITKLVLTFLTLGVMLDISSTTLMIIGSGQIPITVHGFIGYSALAAMLIDAVLIWRYWLRKIKARQSRAALTSTRATPTAGGWWLISPEPSSP